jgi:predicted nucleotidyltransferase
MFIPKASLFSEIRLDGVHLKWWATVKPSPLAGGVGRGVCKILRASMYSMFVAVTNKLCQESKMIMTRQELINQSETYIRLLLKKIYPITDPSISLWIHRRDNRWNSDYDLWIDADIPRKVIAELSDQFDESFVPFKVDIVTTPQLNGRFAERVKQEATQWM